MNKFMLILAAALLLVPQFAAARLCFCVDPHIGETSFTGKRGEAGGSPGLCASTILLPTSDYRCASWFRNSEPQNPASTAAR